MPSKKKSFFGVFQEVNTNDDDELEEEPAKFKFNRDSKSIKDHFAVERKKKKSEKKLDLAGIEESPKKCAKRKSRKNSPNDKDQNASEEEEIDKIQNKKKTFFGVFKDGNQDQQEEKEEVRFKFHTNITDEIDKSCSSPKTLFLAGTAFSTIGGYRCSTPFLPASLSASSAGYRSNSTS